MQKLVVLQQNLYKIRIKEIVFIVMCKNRLYNHLMAKKQ